MPETNPVHRATVIRKARFHVTRTLGQPCPTGYRVGDSIPVDLEDPEEAFRCSGAREALEPYIRVARQSNTAEPLRFAASCHCPYGKSEVVFYLHASRPFSAAS